MEVFDIVNILNTKQITKITNENNNKLLGKIK